MAKGFVKHVLSGAHGTVKINGIEWFEATGINAQVTANRSEIKDGMDIDTKVVSTTGEGTLTQNHVYSRGRVEFLRAWNNGEDMRVTIDSSIADPDAYGKQVERTVIGNAWFNTVTLTSWSRGEAGSQEIPFGFTPSSVDMPETVEVV